VLLLLTVVLLQADGCGADARTLLEQGRRLANELSLDGAAAAYAEAGRRGCGEGRVAALYLRGLEAARSAYRAGGSEESLAPVRVSVSALETLAGAGDASAEIGRAVLMAAAAAAQSERGDMGLWLEQAIALEKRLLAAKQTPLPITAHEVAGDLWLQVHRFDEARKAYRDAADLIGSTSRIAAGLARTSVRLQDVTGACASYRSLLAMWAGRTAEPADIRDARTYVNEHGCAR
jgi:tetratricopeptide (TPR) repeat protein